MDIKDIPSVPEDLLKCLEERYPEECAQPHDQINNLMFYGGKRDLVRWLRVVFDEQTNPDKDLDDVRLETQGS